ESPQEYDEIRALADKGDKPVPEALAAELDHMARRRRVNLTRFLDDERWSRAQLKAWVVKRGILKPAGVLRTWPCFEDPPPNPFLMITGQTGKPWETGHFWDWLLTEQVPVLIEPLVKFLSPVVYFFSPHTGWLTRIYLVLVILWTLATWALFGAAITRMAAV